MKQKIVFFNNPILLCYGRVGRPLGCLTYWEDKWRKQIGISVIADNTNNKYIYGVYIENKIL